MFVTDYNPNGDSKTLDKLKQSSIWKNLDAVKNNRVFINDFDTFYPYDPISVSKQVDLITEMLGVDKNATFGIYENTEKGQFWVFNDNGGRGGQAVYNALGLKAPEKIQKDIFKKGEIKELSLEVVPEYDVVMNDDNYDKLSKIAPTVVIPYNTAKNVQETVKMFGDIAGAKEEAEQFLADFDRKSKAARKKIAQDVKIPTHPKRIVTDFYAGELFTVGANVVGSGSWSFSNPFLKDRMKDVTDLGDPINVEKVMKLKPDLTRIIIT
ncbi:hypothetical protein DT075_04565 [Bacillus licheniformis]|nr:hypothetical protein DT075_04565 [Bacillus licheniformis]